MQSTSFILTYRYADDPARRRNLEVVLAWLREFPLAEIIVVEQDVAPTLGDLAFPSNARQMFAYNPGPFNKSWGFNVGWRASRGSILVFGDADVVCSSLPAAITACRSGVPAVRPFVRVVDLDEAQSVALHENLSRLADPAFGSSAAERSAAGEHSPFCGALIVFQRSYFELLGGWDERFVGWGGEDDAMTVKLERAAIPRRAIDATAYHLRHRRANADLGDDPDYRNNLALVSELQTLSDEALRRLCEVAAQLAGHRERNRPSRGLA
jgi:hypothetical protein